MTLGLAYWILLLVWLVLGLAGTNWPVVKANWQPSTGALLLFLLFLILGWAAFGAPIK